MTQPCPTRRCVDLNQGVQFPIAKAYADMRAAELMVYHAAARSETGANVGAEANMAKMLAADASWAAADMCVPTFGGFGFAEEYDVERKFRGTRLYREIGNESGREKGGQYV